MRYYIHILIMMLAVSCAACRGNSQSAAAATDSTATVKKDVPVFDADSAYAFIAAQTAFGPRVPGSEASRRCASWLESKLRQYGAQNVCVQKAKVQAYDGTTLDINNITAQFNTAANRRVLLLSHWDSRPWADHDPDAANHRKPIDGANDGASGVGVILEIARNLAARQPGIGIDVLFTDAEDYGTHAQDAADTEDSWCLGTQYWVNNPTIDLRKLNYAILLDMVGGKDAVFAREYFSNRAAPAIYEKLHKAATEAGYSSRFPNADGNPIVDDHIYLIRAGVPAIDIIETNNPTTGGFNPTWHTMADNIENIDKNTLKAVGQTLLQLLY